MGMLVCNKQQPFLHVMSTVQPPMCQAVSTKGFDSDYRQRRPAASGCAGPVYPVSAFAAVTQCRCTAQPAVLDSVCLCCQSVQQVFEQSFPGSFIAYRMYIGDTTRGRRT